MKYTPLSGLVLLVATIPSVASSLRPTDGVANYQFGFDVALSSEYALVSTNYPNGNGAAYVYSGVGTGGQYTQNLKLSAFAVPYAQFGESVALSGKTALVGALVDASQPPSTARTGAAYLFRDLDLYTGTMASSLTLRASDGVADDYFGKDVALSGGLGLVSAFRHNSQRGAVYLYRGLDDPLQTGTRVEDAKLVASDGAPQDHFGVSVALDQGTAAVGAFYDDDKGSNSGSVYLYRNLDQSTGATVFQSAKLTASDGAVDDFFGRAVSLSENRLVVGAANAGAAYLYTNIDTITTGTAEAAKLVASDAGVEVNLGFSVALSGENALAGAFKANGNRGAAYLYLGVSGMSGVVTESIRIEASAPASNEKFGHSVSLEGDRFLIGATGGAGNVATSGVAYFGSVKALTTLDDGNTTLEIDRISFTSQVDWIVGESTGSNQVVLTSGDRATVEAAGRAVYVGKNASANHNRLTLEGALKANFVYIGSSDGNRGNTVHLGTTATFDPVTFRLAAGNHLELAGDYSETSSLLTYLNGSLSITLQGWDDGTAQWVTLDDNNFGSYFLTSYDPVHHLTTLASVPEPGTWLLLNVTVGAGFLLWRRRFRQ